MPRTAVGLPFHFFRKNEIKNRHGSRIATLARSFIMTVGVLCTIIGIVIPHQARGVIARD